MRLLAQPGVASEVSDGAAPPLKRASSRAILAAPLALEERPRIRANLLHICGNRVTGPLIDHHRGEANRGAPRLKPHRIRQRPRQSSGVVSLPYLPSCEQLLLDRNEPGCDDRALRTTASAAGSGRGIRAGRRVGGWTPFGLEQVRVVAGRIASDRLRACERRHNFYHGGFVRGVLVNHRNVSLPAIPDEDQFL